MDNEDLVDIFAGMAMQVLTVFAEFEFHFSSLCPPWGAVRLA